MEAPPPLLLTFLVLLFLLAPNTAAAARDGCSVGCDLALGSYYVAKDMNITFIASLFGFSDYRALAKYNRGLPRLDYVTAGDRLDVPFPCECLALPSDPASTYLAASIPYVVAPEDTYISIARKYNNLTTAGWLQATNTYPTNKQPRRRRRQRHRQLLLRRRRDLHRLRALPHIPAQRLGDARLRRRNSRLLVAGAVGPTQEV